MEAFRKRQEELKDEFEKLSPPLPQTFTRKDGSVLRDSSFTSHCPICLRPTELHATTRDMPDWECAQQTGIHRCDCVRRLDTIPTPDGYIYFCHSVRIWYKRDDEHGDARIASYDINGIHESRPMSWFERLLRKLKKAIHTSFVQKHTE